MASPSSHYADARALVIDGNPTSRSILVSQLRELGVGTVTQCSRVLEARRKLEFSSYDVVICEQSFDREESSGQELLDDLRRNQLLPFYTVFVMVTAEATYAKVAEAAEAALDAYLLKPHTAGKLLERIELARQRKAVLQDVFTAIEKEDFVTAANLCLKRFAARGNYWLYAARIGAELMLRNGRIEDAQKMYQAVVDAKTVPWARLGVARAQLEGGHPQRASNTLESLIDAEPGFADAYDVMGRAQFEMGNFDKAMDTYRMATTLTPGSIPRLLKHGMMAYYTGDRAEGMERLERATRIGLDSKMYDPQTLVLMAFAHLDNNDRKALTRCCDDLTRLVGKNPDSVRLQRLSDTAQALSLIQQHQTAHVLEEVRRMIDEVLNADFDYEAGCNLLALMSQLATRSIHLTEMEDTVETLGRRFATSRALTELLARVVTEQPDFAQRIRASHTQILKLTEEAMTLSLHGKPQEAVKKLMQHGEETRNAKLIESAYLVLQRYAEQIPDRETLLEAVQALREHFRTTDIHAGLGDLLKNGRTAGGISMPGGYKAPSKEGLLAQYEPLYRTPAPQPPVNTSK